MFSRRVRFSPDETNENTDSSSGNLCEGLCFIYSLFFRPIWFSRVRGKFPKKKRKIANTCACDYSALVCPNRRDRDPQFRESIFHNKKCLYFRFPFFCRPKDWTVLTVTIHQIIDGSFILRHYSRFMFRNPSFVLSKLLHYFNNVKSYTLVKNKFDLYNIIFKILTNRSNIFL